MGQGMKRIKELELGVLWLLTQMEIFILRYVVISRSPIYLLYVLAFFSAKAPNINKRIYSFSKAFPHPRRSPRAESSRLDGLILS